MGSNQNNRKRLDKGSGCLPNAIVVLPTKPYFTYSVYSVILRTKTQLNMKPVKIFTFVVTLSVAGILIASCSKNSVVNEAIKPTEAATFDLIQDRILTPTCALSGCHASETDGAFRQHGLLLTKGRAYDYLVGKDPKNALALEDKFKRVVPFNSLTSLFYHKLNWDGAGHHAGRSYGSPMPLGGTPLFNGQIEFVRRWIESGAPRTGNVADTTLLKDRTPSYNAASFVGLEPPKTGEGLQVRLTDFTVQPNFEREVFVRQEVGNKTELYVNRVAIKMRPGSHHFILYSFRNDNLLPTMNQMRDIRNPDGSQNLLTLLSMQNHIFWAGAQNPNYDYTLPEGAALQLPANYSFDLNSHYVNKTAQPLTGEVYANLYTVPKEKVKYVVKALDLGNTSLSLPANKKTTVTKNFTFDTNVKVLMLTSHAHKLLEKFVIKIKGGSRDGEQVYSSTDWENPEIINFKTAIVLKKGEGFTSEITYNNTTGKAVSFGLKSEDEMGIIFGYYYEDK